MSAFSIGRIADAPAVCVLDGDLDDEALSAAGDTRIVACDIETTGLDWRQDRIGTVQIQAGAATYVVRPGREKPDRLASLVEDPSILKVFHHAMFDLRFLAYRWAIRADNLACTKIASKLLDPHAQGAEHSLTALARRYLGVELDKTLRTSDWTRHLSADQLRYASDDVRYLVTLHDRIDRELHERGLSDLQARCYAHLSTRVELEIGGYPDVFLY